MLIDPLPFSANPSDANLGSLAATDFGPGSSVRVSNVSFFGGDQGQVLRISHSKSNENKPIDTERLLIRLDCRYVGDDSGTPILDKASTASVYMVIVFPKDGIASTANLVALTKGFVSSMFSSGVEATFDTLKATLNGAYLTRLLDGEA